MTKQKHLTVVFRWMNNLLLRELPLRATIRLWDTYLAEKDGFSKFHLYVCAAFLIRWKQDLSQRNDFQVRGFFFLGIKSRIWARISVFRFLNNFLNLCVTNCLSSFYVPKIELRCMLMFKCLPTCESFSLFFMHIIILYSFL